jgi:hypothetical protein
MPNGVAGYVYMRRQPGKFLLTSEIEGPAVKNLTALLGRARCRVFETMTELCSGKGLVIGKADRIAADLASNGVDLFFRQADRWIAASPMDSTGEKHASRSPK